MDFKVGIAQIAPALGDVHENMKRIELCIERALDEKTDIVVFPELALTGYTLKDMVPSVSLRLDSPEMKRLADASGRISIAVGFVEESPDYRFFNSAAYLEKGRIAHVHRKVYLPNYGMFEENRDFAAGSRFRAFNAEFGRCGILICEDMWHPSAAYVIAQDGCELLIALSCSPARGAQSDGDLYSADAWQTLNRVYAHLFSQYVVYANRVGYEDGVGYWGGSEAIGPDGSVIARAKQFEEQFLTAELSSDAVRRARISSPLLRDERLDITLRELKRIDRERIK